MKIKDIMSKKIISCNINSNIFEVAQLMKKNNIGFIPIIDKEIKGVITDRDIIIRVIANNDYDTNIKPYINESVISIDENEDISCALRLMSKHKIKRLIITNNNKLSGILSLSDIINSNLFEQEIIKCIKNIYTLMDNNELFHNKIDDFYL